jgi:RNA polymerase sigma factor (sigma-70 family)
MKRDRDRDESFLALLNTHQALLHRIARAYAADADRQDLFQDIVCQLWRSYPTFRRESAVVTWMYRVALNTAITSLRRRSRRPAPLPIEAAGEPAAPAIFDESDAAALHRAIRELNDIDRALVMCYLDDFSYARIGEILGMSESNVGARLTRVRAKLQALLTRQE